MILITYKTEKNQLKISTTDKLSIPASTTTIANQSQSPLPPLATAAAAAARDEVRLWDRDWAIPGSVDVGLEEGLGLEVGNKREYNVTTGWIEKCHIRE